MAPTATTTDVKLVRTINAPVEHIWQALTNRDDLCDWLCFDAEIRAEKDGYAFFRWYEGDYAFARFEEVIEYEKLVCSWEDQTSTEKTTVGIYLKPTDGGIELTLKHKGFATEDAAQSAKETWETRLHELTGIMETGERHVITDRVIIGIYPREIDAEELAALNIPVDYGVHVNNVVPGYSAANAGIQPGDVIVQVDDTKIDNNNSIFSVTRGKTPGDSVHVTYYRGAEKHSMDAKLRGYPIPPLPADYDKLILRWRERYANTIKRVHKLVAPLTDEALNAKPDADTWSVRESIAHLILWERHTRNWLSTYLNGPRRINPFQGEQERINALLIAYPDTQDLINLFERTQQETLAILGQFTPELKARKNILWWVNYEADYNPQTVEQTLTALAERLKS